MRPYQITITMPDGWQGRLDGVFADGFAALIHAMGLFPNARRISARRVPV